VTVVPKSVSNLKVSSTLAKKIKVNWKKDSTITGYQIQYSTNKNFKNAKSVTVKKAKTTSTTISKLTSKKKYYVRIRAYKTVSKSTFYSSWSTAKNVKVQ
ncbi:MAG: fibronectin type III domain-containing protein, partial [Lachnospiraceae bacterium]